MTSRRGRTSRFIAAILTIALSTQIVGAQVGNCMKMNASHERSDHAAMLHDASSDDVTAVTGAGNPEAPGTPACSQSILCLNAPAVLDVTDRVVQVAPIASPIMYSTSTHEARSPSPDSPPPKI